MSRIHIPARIPPLAIAAFGILACAGVGYLTSQNPAARPTGIGVPFRVLIIGTITVTAMYAQTSALQERMGSLLLGACVFSAFWLLNGSSDRFAFSVGVLFSGPALVVTYYLMLAHPSGRLQRPDEVRFMALLGGAGVLLWTVGTLTSAQPPLGGQLLACAPHCLRNSFFLGSGIDAVLPALRIGLGFVWAALTLGAVVLLERRRRSVSGPLRRSLLPVWVASWLAALLLLGNVAAQSYAGQGLQNGVGAGYVSMWAVVPLAILAGLFAERLFMGQALARLVSQLAQDPGADPGSLMAATFQHASLSIAYPRPGTAAYVDFLGRPVADPKTVPSRDVAWIERDGRAVAAVTYDRDLADQRRFIQAAADAAGMRIEQAQLLADLRASAAEVAASRLRLVEATQTERQRLERDLHDGVQQELLGLRLKLELASDALNADPAEGRRLIDAVGRRLDDVLESLRALARGIYPSILRDRGLIEAVRSAARRSPIRVSVRGTGLGRYGEDVEVAIYFCCLEALQNTAKHGGQGAEAAIRFWHDGDKALLFEIADTGKGFGPVAPASGMGLANMRDRIEAVGGTLTITSRRGEGAVIRGRVPVSTMSQPTV